MAISFRRAAARPHGEGDAAHVVGLLVLHGEFTRELQPPEGVQQLKEPGRAAGFRAA